MRGRFDPDKQKAFEKRADSRPLRDVDEAMSESTRLEPLEDGAKKNKDGKRYAAYVCPSCGNPVTRYANRYTCSACRQKLLWPGVDYSEYDARGEEMRKARQARRENSGRTYGNKAKGDDRDGKPG